MTRERQIEELTKAVAVQLECSWCHVKSSSRWADAQSHAEKLYEKGWRIVDGPRSVRCGACVDKKP